MWLKYMAVWAERMFFLVNLLQKKRRNAMSNCSVKSTDAYKLGQVMHPYREINENMNYLAP